MADAEVSTKGTSSGGKSKLVIYTLCSIFIALVIVGIVTVGVLVALHRPDIRETNTDVIELQKELGLLRKEFRKELDLEKQEREADDKLLDADVEGLEQKDKLLDADVNSLATSLDTHVDELTAELKNNTVHLGARVDVTNEQLEKLENSVYKKEGVDQKIKDSSDAIDKNVTTVNGRVNKAVADIIAFENSVYKKGVVDQKIKGSSDALDKKITSVIKRVNKTVADIVALKNLVSCPHKQFFDKESNYCKQIQQSFKSQLMLTQEFTSDLLDSNSKQYKTLKTTVENGLYTSYKKILPTIGAVTVTQFHNRSVIVEYEAMVLDGSAQTLSLSQFTEAAKRVQEDTGSFAGLTLSADFTPTVGEPLATILLVGGYVDGELSHSVEQLTVTKRLDGTFPMNIKTLEAAPDRAGTEGMYMARIGTTPNIFLKLNNHAFLFNTNTSTWKTWKRWDEDTPRAIDIPALTFGEGLLTFTEEGVHLIEAENLTSTSLGPWPTTYKPMRKHKAVKINATSFIVSGGRDLVGGYFNTLSGAVLGTVTGDTLTWTTLPDMSTKRYKHCTFLFNNKVFVVGGYDDSADLRSVDYLDMASPTPLHQQQWTSAPDLPEALSSHTCNVAEDGSFVVMVGGNYGDSPSKTVLIMDGNLKTEVLDQQLPYTRREHASVVLENQN